jgi:hypothetical protein
VVACHFASLHQVPGQCPAPRRRPAGAGQRAIHLPQHVRPHRLHIPVHVQERSVPAGVCGTMFPCCRACMLVCTSVYVCVWGEAILIRVCTWGWGVGGRQVVFICGCMWGGVGWASLAPPSAMGKVSSSCARLSPCALVPLCPSCPSPSRLPRSPALAPVDPLSLGLSTRTHSC